MRTQTLRQTLIFATLLTVAWGAVLLVTENDQEREETEPLDRVFTLLLFFVVIFGTMRLSNRLVTRFFPPRQPPPLPPPTAPSTERPAHAQRRRRRRGRRPRG